LVGGGLILDRRGGEADEEISPDGAVSARPQAVRSSRQEEGIASGTSGEELHHDPGAREEGESEPRTAPLSDDIEEIKRRIYEREIESIERLHLLDELVQTGDADTREFWGDDWSGVDDWKRSSNGFSLERSDDGALIFIPDEETARTYSFFESLEVYAYDEANRAFVNEIDYYGKTIVNVLKFIDADVLVMMTISGRKVDLNIYQRSAEQR
jgi:hypothetical protein